jgi:hypothetical protein
MPPSPLLCRWPPTRAGGDARDTAEAGRAVPARPQAAGRGEHRKGAAAATAVSLLWCCADSPARPAPTSVRPCGRPHTHHVPPPTHTHTLTTHHHTRCSCARPRRSSRTARPTAASAPRRSGCWTRRAST